MLDAQPAKLKTVGTVTVTHERVIVEGFDGDHTSCRDVAALAALWAIGRLQQELMATLQKPGGGRIGLE